MMLEGVSPVVPQAGDAAASPVWALHGGIPDLVILLGKQGEIEKSKDFWLDNLLQSTVGYGQPHKTSLA